MDNLLRENMDYLRREDEQVGVWLEREYARQQENIELIASENITSPAVMAAVGSCLTNKYAEGYPGRRYYGGCEYVDEIERLAIDRVKKLFGAEHANVQPHSGAQANLAAFMALLEPGDTLVGMDLSGGGHLTHGAVVNQSGKIYRAVSYGVEPETGRIDYDRVEDIMRRNRPRVLVAGASAYPRALDFKAFADIAHRHGAALLVDMAHIAGLVAGGQHMNPVPYADVVTTTTHKTLRGPRGGVILAREEWAKKIDSAVFPGMQGGPLLHVIAGKAVCFREAMKPEFADYARRTVENAAALAEAMKAEGFDLVSGGTDNHLMLVDLRSRGITGRALQERLDGLHITVNKNAIPNDPEKPFVTSGIRVGTPAVTSRGFKEPEMVKIARWMALVAQDFEANAAPVRAEVDALCRQFPIYE